MNNDDQAGTGWEKKDIFYLLCGLQISPTHNSQITDHF